MYEQLRVITQLQSLALTIPMLVLCFLVLYELKKPIFSTCFGVIGEKKTQMCWIICGLILAFIGKIVESAWWFIPWTLSYLESPYWKIFNDAGVFFNIIFRQIFFTMSAYCHLRAFIAPDKASTSIRTMNLILFFSLIMGQLYVVLLLTIKPFGF